MRALGSKVLSFNLDALKPENRTVVLDELKSEMQEGEKVKVLVHSLAKGNLKPMVSEDGPELKNDDFHLTIDAMAISLYDWTKSVFESFNWTDFQIR